MPIETLITVGGSLLALVGWLALGWYMGWTQRGMDAAIQELEEEEQRMGAPMSDMTVVGVLLGITTSVLVAMIFGFK